MYGSWDMVCDKDRRMVGQKKQHRWVPHLKNQKNLIYRIQENLILYRQTDGKTTHV